MHMHFTSFTFFEIFESYVFNVLVKLKIQNTNIESESANETNKSIVLFFHMML